MSDDKAAKKAARKAKRKKFWNKCKDVIGKVAPALGTVVGGPFGAIAGDLIADSLGIDRDDEQALEKAINDPALAARLLEIQENNKTEIRKLELEAEIAEINADAAKVESINETMRVELAAKSGFRASWRPLFGYISAVSFGAQMLGLTYVMIFQTALLSDVAQGVGMLTTLWAIALAVLGINIRSRTDEKAMESGNYEGGMFKGLAGIFKKNTP